MKAFKTAPKSGFPETELIRIVFDQIAAKEFEGLRFQEVAEAAGITNANFYYYFPSKEAMIQSLVDWLVRDLSGTARVRSVGSQRPGHKCHAGVADALRRSVSAIHLGCPLLRCDYGIGLAGATRSRNRENHRERDRSWEQQLRGILQRGIEDGSFRRDIDVRAACLALMVQIKGIAQMPR